MTTKPEYLYMEQPETPFAKNDRVSVIRTSRAWYDGKLIATVVKAYLRESGATYYYFVKDDNGEDHKVNHTRDMRAFQSADCE